MRARAVVYARSGTYYVSADHRTRSWAYHHGEPHVEVPVDAGTPALASAFRTALDGYREDVPDTGGSFSWFLERSGCRSYAQFIRTARYACLEETDEGAFEVFLDATDLAPRAVAPDLQEAATAVAELLSSAG